MTDTNRAERAWALLCQRLGRDPDISEESDTCTLRAAWKAMIEFASQAAQPAEADDWVMVPREATQGMREAATELPIDTGRGHNTALNWEEAAAVWSAMLAATQKAPATDAGEVERLTHVIDRDRYAAAACVGAIEHVLHARRWLREAGRGSYAYDDERYQEEFGLAFDEIQEALRPMRALSKDKTDCTRDEDKVKAARAAGAEKFAALATPPAPNDEGADA